MDSELKIFNKVFMDLVETGQVHVALQSTKQYVLCSKLTYNELALKNVLEWLDSEIVSALDIDVRSYVVSRQ